MQDLVDQYDCDYIEQVTALQFMIINRIDRPMEDANQFRIHEIVVPWTSFFYSPEFIFCSISLVLIGLLYKFKTSNQDKDDSFAIYQK